MIESLDNVTNEDTPIVIQTSYTDIYDLFLMIVDDYELTELYHSSEEDFTTYLQGFLILAIPDFRICKKDLKQRDDSSGTFLIELSDTEKSILAKLMAKYWFKKKIQDVTQFQGHLNDKDFKFHSEAQNLTAKRDYYNIIREEVDQDLNDYGYEHSDWL